MKLLYLLSITCFIMANAAHAQKQELEIYGHKITAEEITGIKKFNDLGTRYNTSVINDLTDDINTFYWRLGKVRRNKNDYMAGFFSLFDLSNYDHKQGYPILDSIDYTFYEEVGFNILENKDISLTKDTAYQRFKNTFKKSTMRERRILLWDNKNFTIRNRLFKTKYYINVQPISDSVTRQLTRDMSDSLTVDFTDILNKITTDVSIKSELSTYLQQNKHETLNLKGEYISVIFRQRYIGIASYIIGGLDSSKLNKNDEFNNHLIQYINDKETFAFNSAIYGFRFKGGYNNVRLDSTSLKNNTHISAEKIADLSNKFNLEIQKRYNRTFKNKFDKLWIIMFATDAGFDNLRFSRNLKLCKKKNRFLFF